MDEEIREILAKMKLHILEEAESKSRCCRLTHAFEPGHDIGDPRELLEVLEGCRVAFVMFYSPTCPYCRALTPIFLALAEEYGGRAAFVRVNTYRHPQLAAYYRVMGVPTVIVFIDGRPVAGFSGLVDPEDFESLVIDVLRRADCPLQAQAPA
ncbi:MAG: thioredoxin family protein [Desulfurococcales archaeon]|nr:thioredoxin family protein [Desulfurococcales archaeon]